MQLLEECTGSEGGNGQKRQEPLLDRGGALVGGRGKEQEGGGQHGTDTKKREGQAGSRRRQEVDGDAREGLNGKEEVVEALIEGHFLGGLRGFAVHAKDGQGARGPREGLDVEDEDVEGGGQEGCDHSDNQHEVSFVDVSLNWTPTYSAHAQINLDTTPQLSKTQRVSPLKRHTCQLFTCKVVGMATCAPSLFTALINTEMGTWNAVESALSEAGNALTLGRFLVLRTVRDTPACRIQEVAASQGITLGAASRLVDRLHRDGLVHRTPCEHDRRATILTVTEQGLAHLEEACMIVEKEQERLFAPLSPAQREELTRSLALIAEATKGHA